MFSEQRIRAWLYYLSVSIFIIGLPIILTFALGLKFNQKTLKLTPTGLISIRTQPEGASIYLDGKLLNDKTPATLHELLPGTYNLRLELEGRFIWIGQAPVFARQVTLLEKIILFPLRPHIKQINKENLDAFWMDEEKKAIYFVFEGQASIFRSDLEGLHPEKIGQFIKLSPWPLKWKFSADRQKVLYFNQRQIGVTLSNAQNSSAGDSFVIDYRLGLIKEAFWHSDNYHIIVVSNKNIAVLEAGPAAQVIELVALNSANTEAHYDSGQDALYFNDWQKAEDGNTYNNLYRLDLNPKASIFQELKKLRTNGKTQ